MIEEILSFMDEVGVTRKEMAEMIGLTPQEFYRRANAINDFTVTEMEKMCMILGIKFQLVHTDEGWNIEAWRKQHIMKTRNPHRKQRKDTK